MGNSYYYLNASLPELDPRSSPPILKEEFFARCREALSGTEMAILEAIELTPVEGLRAPTVVHEWWVWERSLRLTLASLRARQLRRPMEEVAVEEVECLDAVDLARKAFEMPSPEEAETLLTRGRWKALDAIGAFVYFGLPRLALYRLRLALLERREQFQVEVGRQRFGAVVERARMRARRRCQSVGSGEPFR